MAAFAICFNTAETIMPWLHTRPLRRYGLQLWTVVRTWPDHKQVLDQDCQGISAFFVQCCFFPTCSLPKGGVCGPTYVGTLIFQPYWARTLKNLAWSTSVGVLFFYFSLHLDWRLLHWPAFVCLCACQRLCCSSAATFCQQSKLESQKGWAFMCFALYSHHPWK